MDFARQIDLEKLRIEVTYIPPTREIFNHMAADAKNLYLATQRVPAKSLADNYRPEFLKVTRDMQRATIKRFGFSIRKIGEKKGFKFNVAKSLALIDYRIETKADDLPLTDENLEKVNRDFALAASLFVANSTEEQVDYITNTNEKEISDAEKMAVILFFTEQSKLRTKLSVMEQDLRRLEYESVLAGNNAVNAAKKKRVRDKIAATEKELAALLARKNQFIADKIESQLVEKGKSRSELIASQNVGMAESWSRNKEANLVQDALPDEEIKKKWQAILDSRTRPSHVIADNQVVPVNAKFNVGGHAAEYPRDASLPIAETANCRCVAFHYWGGDLLGTP